MAFMARYINPSQTRRLGIFMALFRHQLHANANPHKGPRLLLHRLAEGIVNVAVDQCIAAGGKGAVAR